MLAKNIQVGEIYRYDRWTRIKVLAKDKTGAIIEFKGGGAVVRHVKGIQVVRCGVDNRPSGQPFIVENTRRITKWEKK